MKDEKHTLIEFFFNQNNVLLRDIYKKEIDTNEKINQEITYRPTLKPASDMFITSA